VLACVDDTKEYVKKVFLKKNNSVTHPVPSIVLDPPTDPVPYGTLRFLVHQILVDKSAIMGLGSTFFIIQTLCWVP
jgi:hypothetical protein